MKKAVCVLLCFILLFTIVGCASENEMKSGLYMAFGSVDGAYFRINTENNTFRFAGGLASSNIFGGKYVINENKLLATSNNGVSFSFEIENEKTDTGFVLREVSGDNSYEDLINQKFEYAVLDS